MVMAAGQPSSACAFSPLASRPSSYRLAAFYKLSCAARISSSSSSSFGFLPCIGGISVRTSRRSVVVKASGSSASRWQDWWRLPPPPPAEKGGALASAPSISDVLWPSAGAFLAMALLGRLDQIMTPKGVSFTIAPLGAVCAVLYATPNAPAARCTFYTDVETLDKDAAEVQHVRGSDCLCGIWCAGFVNFWARLACQEHCSGCVYSIYDCYT